MLKKYLAFVIVVSGSTWAADPNNDITLNFTGKVIKPSCLIAFDSGSVKSIDFGDLLNVSDLRYYPNAANGGVYTWSYAKYKSSPVFYIQISGCSPDQVASNNSGNQFFLTIAPASGEWVVTNTDAGGAGYMDGGISPLTGATGFAAKFLVPYQNASTPTNIPAVPTTWDIFTGSQVPAVRGQRDGVQDGDREDSGHDGSPLSQFDVNMAYLPTSGTGQDLKWLIPMKVKLGMRSLSDPGDSGVFNVSATISVTYY